MMHDLDHCIWIIDYNRLANTCNCNWISGQKKKIIYIKLFLHKVMNFIFLFLKRTYVFIIIWRYTTILLLTVLRRRIIKYNLVNDLFIDKYYFINNVYLYRYRMNAYSIITNTVVSWHQSHKHSVLVFFF